MNHIVADIQRFCMHDGPGVRTVVFLKGCPLNCFWCHNPETKKDKSEVFLYESKCIKCGGCTFCSCHTVGEKHIFRRSGCTVCGRCAKVCPAGALSIAGKEMSSDEIVNTACRDMAFYGKLGGITLSGGEPMLHPERCIELLETAKKAGLNTAVETSGYFPEEYVQKLCDVTDTLLWDIKDTDDKRHIKNTSVSNRRIIENLTAADRCGTPVIIRCIMLKNINLNEAHLKRVRDIFYSLKNAVRVDFLPCHILGGSKAESLGIEYPDLSEYVPTPRDMEYVLNFDKWKK